MASLLDLLYPGGNFLGVEWNTWKIVGWSGNALFFSRFIVQWFATERRKQVVIPTAFWWLSLGGNFTLLSYALFYRGDSVFIFAYAFSWIPYVRNLLIHRAHKASRTTCPDCGHRGQPSSRFCSQCGAPMKPTTSGLDSHAATH